MKIHMITAARIVPLTALMLGACVSQSNYDALQAQNQQLQAQNQQLQAQVAGLQRQASFVEAGDLLFPPGGYQLSPAGEAELRSNIVPKLIGLQNAKVVVYGYTDNAPIGPQLQRAGINDNLTLVVATRRRCRYLPDFAGRQPEHHLGQGVRRYASGGAERHAGEHGEKPPHRNHHTGTRRTRSLSRSQGCRRQSAGDQGISEPIVLEHHGTGHASRRPTFAGKLGRLSYALLRETSPPSRDALPVKLIQNQ